MKPPFRVAAAVFLALQGAGALVWWAAMLAVPSARAAFLPPAAPGSLLLAFLLPDLLLFAGGSLAAAAGVGLRRPWAWPLLCVHLGAALYAGLFCLSLPLVSGGGGAGALLMAPSVLVLPCLVWRLRPGVRPW